MKLRFVFAALLAAAASPLAAQRAKYGPCLTSEALRHYQTVADPQLSPHGHRIVYVQRDSTAAGAAAHLWLASTAGGPPRQLTFSHNAHGGETSPAWTPGGRDILFLAQRDHARTIYSLPLNGGEARPLTIQIGAGKAALPLSVQQFAVSPDGNWIALRARQPLTKAQQAARKAKRDAVIVHEDPHHDRLWLYSFATGKTIPLSPAARQAAAFAWHPDSRALAYVSAPPGRGGNLGPQYEVEIVSIAAPHHARTLAGVPSTVSSLAYSPGGSKLALTAQSRHDTPPGVSALYVIPAAGGAIRDLSDSDNALMPAGRGSLAWSRSGKSLFIGAQRGTELALARYDLAGGPAAWLPSPSAPTAMGFATNRAHTGWAFIAQATNRLPQIAYAKSLPGPATILSRANSSWSSSGWVQAREVSWPSVGGDVIHALYYAPRAPACPGAAPLRDGKFPLILSPHGGPTGAFLQTFSPLVQWFARQGWAVLEPNPRGSTGYGFAFVAANKNDLGDKDFQDEIAGVAWALAHAPVDAHRLGVYGYSYGGEMAGFLEGKTHRFAAIIAGAPVIDQYSEYGTENGSWYDRWFFGRPWRRPQDAWRQSPLAYAAKATTPMLLLQGQADITDPIGQSEEEYRALRQDGVPVRLVTFPREVHGTLAGGIAGAPEVEPWHGFEGRTQIKRWFDRYFALARKSGAGGTGGK